MMHMSLILLFLQLWGNVGVSSSQNVCSKLPEVPHAQVSEDTKRSEYREGHVIRFICVTGFKSDERSRYVCTSVGWVAVRPAACYSCSKLPDVLHAHISEEFRKAPEEYQRGDMIHFTCETGYMSDLAIRYVCTGEGWLAVSHGACYTSASSCDPPTGDGSITVKRLPENNGPILPGDILTFSCDDPGNLLNGSTVLICGKDGQWNNPFPSCIDKCKVPDIPSNVLINPPSVAGETVNKGKKFTFRCRIRSHVVQGNTKVECLTNGGWSDEFPTCGPPVGCKRPPALADGDTKYTTEFSYNHNDRVEYSCQPFYTMDGEPYKTCNNGKWIGNMRCLRPCTVNKQLTKQYNIEFKYKRDDNLYAPHNDRVTFRCIHGTTHDDLEVMHRTCIDGVMHLPRCY